MFGLIVFTAIPQFFIGSVWGWKYVERGLDILNSQSSDMSAKSIKICNMYITDKSSNFL